MYKEQRNAIIYALPKSVDFPKIHSEVIQIFISIVCRRPYCVIAALSLELIVCRFIISHLSLEEIQTQVVSAAFH